MIAILSAAALLCASACGVQTSVPETTTEVPTTVLTTREDIEDDMAQPAMNESDYQSPVR